MSLLANTLAGKLAASWILASYFTSVSINNVKVSLVVCN